MSLVLSPATEARVLQQVATGRYAAPDDLLNHALDLLEAERTGLATRRAEIVANLTESIAQARRGEGITGEALRADHNARKSAYEESLVAQT